LTHPESPQLVNGASCRLPWTHWAAILLIFTAVYVGASFSPALQDDADSTHAEAAREMLASGDYVTLHVNGVRYLEKAPLLYWLVACSFRIFGVNEFAARFPTVLSMLLLAMLAARWGARAFGARAGTYAALFISTAAGFFLFTRILIPEALLSLLIAASFYCFSSALEDRQPWRWYAGYACLALAVLAKGLIPLVFVGITAAIYAVATGDWRRWREMRLPTGLLLFFLIAAPWHILAGLRNPHFLWFYFVNEHFLRFLGKRYPVDYNKVPALLYWSLHLVWLFPWSLYLPLAIRHLRRDFQKLRESAAGDRFGIRTRIICWTWAGVVLTFFAFSTSQEYYTFPGYFPLILLLADAIAEEESGVGRSRWLLWISGMIAALCVIASAVLIAGLWTSRTLPFVSDIGTVLAKHDMSEDTLSMSHMLDLTGESFAALRLPAILAVIALMCGPIASFWFRLRRRHFAGCMALVLTMALFLVAAHVALNRFDPYLSSQVLAKRIALQLQPSDAVMIYGDQAYGSSLLFYLRRPIDLVNGRATSMWFGSTYPDAPPIFLDDADLLKAWNSPTRVFLFVPAYQRARVDSLITSQKYAAAETSGKIIYSNRP